MARKDNMARTKKHSPETTRPVSPETTRPVKKPRAYALRYPLPYCEIADDSSDATADDSSDNVHPNVQMCRAIRKRKQQVTAIRKRVREHSEAVDAEIQVQARSGVDLYTQMAKKMRLRRRSNEKECVMTGDLADLHKLCITAQTYNKDQTNSNGYPTGCRFCTSK